MSSACLDHFTKIVCIKMVQASQIWLVTWLRVCKNHLKIKQLHTTCSVFRCMRFSDLHQVKPVLFKTRKHTYLSSVLFTTLVRKAVPFYKWKKNNFAPITLLSFAILLSFFAGRRIRLYRKSPDSSKRILVCSHRLGRGSGYQAQHCRSANKVILTKAS